MAEINHIWDGTTWIPEIPGTPGPKGDTGLKGDKGDQGLVGPNGLSDVTSIPAGADLNTYTTPGLYHQSDSAWASGGTNYPEPYAGMLTVTAVGTVLPAIFYYQEYQLFKDQPGRFYRRQSYNGVWSPWQLFVTPKAPLVQRFTANGTWTKPAGCTAVQVEVCGGGGGGGGSAATPASTHSVGCSGAGGGYVRHRFAASALPATVSVTVGNAGQGVSNNAGTDGGPSTFGTFITAEGGLGGLIALPSSIGRVGQSVAGGYFSGSVATPDLVVRGGSSARGIIVVGSAAYALPGMPGSSAIGLAPVTSSAAGTGVSANADAKGAGGAGAFLNPSQGVAAGGDGAPGVVIVTSFFG